MERGTTVYRHEISILKYEPMTLIPPVTLPFSPPFLFDCRLYGADGSTRRMGIGDQILQIALVQHVERIVGRENVGAWYNPSYPGSRQIWELSGISALPVADDMQTDKIAGVTVIPMRHHILENLMSRHSPCVYGGQEGSPLAQALFNIVWHDCVPWSPLGISLAPNEYDRARAEARILSWSGCIIACQPLEVTRGNRQATPAVWRQTLCDLNRSFYSPTFAFGCAAHEKKRMETFIESLNLPASWNTVVVVETLKVWKAIIDQSSHLVTGNTSGMWLGIASQTPMTIIGAGVEEHGRMWDAKPDWFTPERGKTVTLQMWQHFQNTMPCPTMSSEQSHGVAIP